MEEYISMRDANSMKQIPRKQALKEIGIKKDGDMLQPPKCLKCGNPCIEVDLGAKYLQCIECGHSSPMYVYADSSFRVKR